MSNGWKVVPVVLVAAGTIALLGGCGGDEPLAHPSDAVQTAFPDLKPASGEPVLPGLTSARPAAGTVEQVEGPFDDRFELEHLTVTAGTVAGELTVTSDVSELLDLQVVAGFYDANGRYLGSARFDQHTLHESADGKHEHEAVRFSIEAPDEFRAKVASAAVGVPVLVNE